MSSLQEKHTIQDESFDQLRYSYTQLKDDYERLKSYNDLLIKILEYYKITYPTYYSSDEIVF